MVCGKSENDPGIGWTALFSPSRARPSISQELLPLGLSHREGLVAKRPFFQSLGSFVMAASAALKTLAHPERVAAVGSEQRSISMRSRGHGLMVWKEVCDSADRIYQAWLASMAECCAPYVATTDSQEHDRETRVGSVEWWITD